MYAVIRTGSSQERVEEGQVVRVDKRRDEVGASVSLTPVLVVDGDRVLAGASLEGATVTGHGRRCRARSEDPGAHLQAQDAPAPPVGPPPAVHDGRDHGHLGEGLTNVQDQGRRVHPQRPRLRRAASRREGVRRHRGDRGLDHRAPARHQVPPRPRRRPRRGRLAVRDARRGREVRRAAADASSSTSL